MAGRLNVSADSDVTASVDVRDSRSVRQAAHRNAAEKLAEQEQQRHLDTQRRIAETQLARDEKQLRQQLQRLQDEQRLLTEEGAYVCGSLEGCIQVYIIILIPLKCEFQRISIFRNSHLIHTYNKTYKTEYVISCKVIVIQRTHEHNVYQNR